MRQQAVAPTNRFAELLGVKNGNVPIGDVMDALKRKGAAIKRLAQSRKGKKK